jgi:hypothetical protein
MFRHELPEPPLAWFSARDISLALIMATEPAWPRASFEHRAAHDVLALTLMLGGTAGIARGPAASDLRRLQRLLADDVEWAAWCQGSLDRPPVGPTVADTEMACSAWRWLARSRLLEGSIQCIRLPGVAFCSGMGVPSGAAAARRVLDLAVHRQIL